MDIELNKAGDNKSEAYSKDGWLYLHANHNANLIPNDILCIQTNVKYIGKESKMIKIEPCGELEKVDHSEIIKELSTIKPGKRIVIIITIPKNKFSLSSTKHVPAGTLIARCKVATIPTVMEDFVMPKNKNEK